MTAVVRERITSERARWLGHLDESTTWMLTVEKFALSRPVDQVQRIAFAYVTTARAWSCPSGPTRRRPDT
ncbi:hypothetical protein [Streptomyces sp. NPDC047434]|uniref:hypothetical protein n=1 Tax=Streptomyces sp. NPDC047434 TaxID=3155143 RepID=UPI0033CAA4CE